jgi:hypothetical protein
MDARMGVPITVLTLFLVPIVVAQTFQRLGACPTLGCLLPPDQSDFLPGQYFDLRVEVHAPVNGSEAYNLGVPDEKFAVTITKDGGDGESRDLAGYFAVAEPPIEKWSFSWYEDLFARDLGNLTIVNVAAKAYRRLALYEPGSYTVTLNYYGGKTTTAKWSVRPLATHKKVKNIIFFIGMCFPFLLSLLAYNSTGDGMTTNMVRASLIQILYLFLTTNISIKITAARLLAHKSINGKYQSRLQLDDFPVLGHQMTHSIDSFITDSANSASALYTGHKSSNNAMGYLFLPYPDQGFKPRFSFYFLFIFLKNNNF